MPLKLINAMFIVSTLIVGFCAINCELLEAQEKALQVPIATSAGLIQAPYGLDSGTRQISNDVDTYIRGDKIGWRGQLGCIRANRQYFWIAAIIMAVCTSTILQRSRQVNVNA